METGDSTLSDPKSQSQNASAKWMTVIQLTMDDSDVDDYFFSIANSAFDACFHVVLLLSSQAPIRERSRSKLVSCTQVINSENLRSPLLLEVASPNTILSNSIVHKC